MFSATLGGQAWSGVSPRCLCVLGKPRFPSYVSPVSLLYWSPKVCVAGGVSHARQFGDTSGVSDRLTQF